MKPNRITRPDGSELASPSQIVADQERTESTQQINLIKGQKAAVPNLPLNSSDQQILTVT